MPCPTMWVFVIRAPVAARAYAVTALLDTPSSHLASDSHCVWNVKVPLENITVKDLSSCLAAQYKWGIFGFWCDYVAFSKKTLKELIDGRK